MSEKKFVIYFGSDKENFESISEVFTDCSPVSFSEMQPTFDFLQSSYVEAIVFETYQSDTGNCNGINLMDLDVLLFYATSDSSENRMVKFYPIDPVERSEASVEQNIAEILYEDLYEKYLFLMQGQTYKSLSPDSLALPEGLDMIADLIGTLDDACVELDENLNSTKVSFNSENENSTASSTQLNSSEKQIVPGGIDEFGEGDKIVKGQKNDLAEDALMVKGTGLQEDPDAIVVKEYDNEDDEVQNINGSAEDLAEGTTLVKGASEELSEDSSLIEGSREDLSEESNRIKGTREDLSEDSNLIKGSRVDLTEENTLIGGAQEDLKEESTTIAGTKKDLKEEAMLVKSLAPEEEEDSKQVIKGERENLKTEFMQVKSLDSTSNEAEEEDDEKKGINQRNKLGQTPVMLFSRAGDFDRAEDLIEKGADISLFCKEGKSVLHYACQNSNNFNLVKYLVEQKNAKLSKRDSSGKDPLYEATISDSPEIVRFLLDNGARINSKINGSTYLHIAAQKNKIQAFKVLLTFGANPLTTDDKGQSVAQYCRAKKKVSFLKVMEAVKRLKEKKAS